MPNTREKAAEWFANRAKDTPMPGAREMFEIAADALRENAAQEWISVKDRLPEKDIRVLVWMKDNEEGYTQMDTDRWSCTMEQGYHWVRWGKSVTHWMPLPEPPKGE